MNRIALLAATFGLASLSPVPSLAAEPTRHWIGTWAASPQPTWSADFALPTSIPAQLSDQTIRQVVRVSAGGKRARIVLSNAYGRQPLVIGAAHLAMSAGGSAVVAGSDRALTFDGQRSVSIPPGAPVVSDPVDLTIAPLSELVISLYLPQRTAPATFHWDGRRTAYLAAGNAAQARAIDADATIDARLLLSGVQVENADATGTVVAFGDSLTDGNGSTPNADRRWPDYLARRLAPHQVAVLNAGISGARVLDSRMGENALARFDRDVLSEPRVKAVIVMMGINDIGWPGSPFAPEAKPMSAERLIAGYRQLIARARARQVRIIGATLPPFEGALSGTALEGHYSKEKDGVRQAVNAWIRGGGAFDAVVDFDALLRDPTRPTRMLPAYDSGDHLHPGDAGYAAMANAIDLRNLLGNHPASGVPGHPAELRGSQHDDAEGDAIPGKGPEIMRGDETQQPAHAQEGGQEREDKAHAEDAEIVHRQQVARLVQLVHGRAEDDRDGKEE
jgi:lysophospholipase L1-like esterase